MRQFMLGRRAGERNRQSSQFRGQTLALEIHEREDSEFRLQLECCILAGMSDGQIADRLGIPSAAVVAYEQLFFNVRDRLTCHDWIHTIVLDSWRRKGLPGFEWWMKRLAFIAGPAVVDLLFGADRSVIDSCRRMVDLVDKFMAALDNDFTPLQVIALALFVDAENRADRAAAAAHDALVAAARQTLVAIESRACDQPCAGPGAVAVGLVA
jgi:hypothetical protein